MISSFIAATLFLSAAPLSSGDLLPDGACCGATCCLIDGTCRQSGDPNPEDACLVCNPAMGSTMWSPSDDPNCAGGSTGNTTDPSTTGDTDATTTSTGSDSDGDSDGGGCSVAGSNTVWGLGLFGLAIVRRRRRR